MNILFVCLENLQRSPTAEEMVSSVADDLKVRSAGVSSTAVNPLDEELLLWADRVYVMTEKLNNRIIEDFPDLYEGGKFFVLDIPDRYFKGEERLKKKLKERFSKDDVLSRYF